MVLGGRHRSSSDRSRDGSKDLNQRSCFIRRRWLADKPAEAGDGGSRAMRGSEMAAIQQDEMSVERGETVARIIVASALHLFGNEKAYEMFVVTNWVTDGKLRNLALVQR